MNRLTPSNHPTPQTTLYQKAMNAERRGAVAVLVYSDPEDDGPGQGPAYPDGPWRSPSSVQRGSVQYNSLCSGDPARADPRYG